MSEHPVVSACSFHVAGTVHKMKESLTPFRMSVAASGGRGSATGKNLLCYSVKMQITGQVPHYAICQETCSIFVKFASLKGEICHNM
jgi:hypothetical protein